MKLEVLLNDITPGTIFEKDDIKYLNIDDSKISHVSNLDNCKLVLEINDMKLVSMHKNSTINILNNTVEITSNNTDTINEDIKSEGELFRFTRQSKDNTDVTIVTPIRAISYADAREKMFELHGDKWGFQYDEDKWEKYLIDKEDLKSFMFVTLYDDIIEDEIVTDKLKLIKDINNEK